MAEEEREQRLTFALLYGPVVQFASTPGQNAPSVVAMPPQLPLSVDVVFQHPPDAVLPDNLAHFCFAPLQKLQVRRVPPPHAAPRADPLCRCAGTSRVPPPRLRPRAPCRSAPRPR